ncbi:MAG: gliding motility-associated C-terminal domain-containing protein, partial [Cytophagales bacterium]|nr:gliding motility-associated C-terminal domain-containing protein [Cytophagales bacterium]
SNINATINGCQSNSLVDTLFDLVGFEAELQIIGDKKVCNDGTNSDTLVISFTKGTSPYTITYLEENKTIEKNNITNASETILISNPAIYTLVSVKDSKNCSANIKGIDTLTAHTLPTATIATKGNNTICDNGLEKVEVEIELTGTAPWSFEYTNGTQTISETSTNSSFVFTEQQKNNYQLVSVKDAFCTGTTQGQAIINVIPSPQPSINITDTTICETEQITLTSSPAQNIDIAWYKDNKALENQKTNSLLINGIDSEGEYTVYWDNGTCGNFSPITTINVLDIPTVDAGENMQVEEGSTFQLNGSTNSPTYQWTPTTYLSNPQSLLTNAEAVENIEYILIAGEEGCQATDTVSIYLKRPILIPNGFSPNGDGLNDTWIIEGLSPESHVFLAVYNRWGNVVYESFYNSNKPWNGVKNGEVLPVATYYYILTIDHNETYQGSVSIVK